MLPFPRALFSKKGRKNLRIFTIPVLYRKAPVLSSIPRRKRVPEICKKSRAKSQISTRLFCIILHDLKVVKRKEVAGKIKEAREQGDLSENAEYDAAKDEQRDIEARIEEIEKILKNAEVVVEDEVDLDRISVGCKVKVHDYEFEEDMELKIVGSTEANSLDGKISNESPVGKALIGAHTNDIVEVEMPSGIMKYKVLEIQRNV